MKNLLFALIFLIPVVGVSADKSLITDVVQIRCGWSDSIYKDLANQLSEKSKMNFNLSSKGKETGRRLYIYSDRSWFLSFEYLSKNNVAQDISCIVAKGSGETSEDALNFILKNCPVWSGDQENNSWHCL